MGRRLERLNEQFRRELADLLLTQVKDPRVGPVTITGVRVSPDLAVAKVLVSFTGEPDADARTETLEGLEAASAFLRTAIAGRLSIRHAPELRFEVDVSGDHARRIETLLREVRPEGGWESDDDAAAPGDDAPSAADAEDEVDAGEDDAEDIAADATDPDHAGGAEHGDAEDDGRE